MDTREHFLANTAGYSSPPSYTPQGFYYLNLHTTTTQYHEAALTPQIFASSGIAPDFNNYSSATRCFPEYFSSFTDNNCHFSNANNSNNNHLTNNENCNNNYYTGGYEIHEENLNKNQKLSEKVQDKSNSDCDCSFSYAESDEYEIAPYEGQRLQNIEVSNQSENATEDPSNYSEGARKNYAVLNSVVKDKGMHKVQNGSKSGQYHKRDQLAQGEYETKKFF